MRASENGRRVNSTSRVSMRRITDSAAVLPRALRPLSEASVMWSSTTAGPEV